MALGATHWNWSPPVDRVVQLILSSYPQIRCNTYKGHPWPEWDAWSVDLWGEGGRGDPLDARTAWSSARFLLRQPGRPLIRHLIVEHSIWTSWGGWSFWAPRDHSGQLLHTHVTYWPPWAQ